MDIFTKLLFSSFDSFQLTIETITIIIVVCDAFQLRVFCQYKVCCKSVVVFLLFFFSYLLFTFLFFIISTQQIIDYQGGNNCIFTLSCSCLQLTCEEDVIHYLHVKSKAMLSSVNLHIFNKNIETSAILFPIEL